MSNHTTSATPFAIDTTNYIGIDLHSDNIAVCVLRNELNAQGRLLGKVLWRGKITLTQDLAAVNRALAPYCSMPHMATVESTYNWYGLADLFERNGWKLCLADPTTVKKFKDKFSDDRTDAEFLADRMRLGDLHSTSIMPRDARAFRDLVRSRASLSQDRARHSVILINMVNNQTYVHVNRTSLDNASDKLMADGAVDEILGSLFTNHHIAVKAAAHLRMLHGYNEEILRIEREIADSAKLLPQYCHRYIDLLQTIKGCGPVLSTIIASEVNDVGRFANAKHFVSYCRLAPSVRLSNGKVKGEGNAKNGNAYLSWSLTELANLVVRFNPAAKRKFDKLLAKHNKMRCRAIRPIAAMLARAVFYMMRDNKPFNVEMLFGKAPTATKSTKCKASLRAATGMSSGPLEDINGNPIVREPDGIVADAMQFGSMHVTAPQKTRRGRKPRLVKALSEGSDPGMGG